MTPKVDKIEAVPDQFQDSSESYYEVNDNLILEDLSDEEGENLPQEDPREELLEEFQEFKLQMV